MVAVSATEIGRRADELARGVLAPLVLGGEVRLVRPLGVALALELGRGGRGLVDVELGSRVDVARVRRARLLAPVDTLPPPDADEWALVAALNDLLQATNHELSGPLTRGRHARLLASVVDLCGRIGAPLDLGAAIARHATLGRCLEILRTDTRVVWWTGSAVFRGQAPPGRLLRWPDFRRVQVEPQSVTLSDMADGLPPAASLAFDDVLSVWLGRSPLSDLATVARARPSFGWSRSTLSLVAVPLGRALAHRAIARQPREPAVAALTRAASGIPRELGELASLARAFAEEAAARPTETA